MGESGSGKTVTALSIMRLLNYPAAFHPKGKIRFLGTDLLQSDERAMREIRGNRISMIFQEPLTSLNPLHTIEKQVSEVIEIHKGIARKDARPHVIELLAKVGLSQAEQRLGAYPHQLSGGQRQRVMIAITLANEPDLLIADEPTTALDVTIQAQILELLKAMKQALSMSVLLITHDLNIVRKMADRVCVMKDGLIVEQGTAREIFEAPKHPYTKHLIEAEPKGKPPAPAAGAPVVMEAENLKVWFPIRRGVLRRTVGHVKAVDGVTLKLREGGTVGVVGESGSGKTTLGLALLRLIPSRGASSFSAARSKGSISARSGPCAATCRSCSRTLTARFPPGFRWRRSWARGSPCTARSSLPPRAKRGSPKRSPRWAWTPRRATATRTSSPAASASASQSRAP